MLPPFFLVRCPSPPSLRQRGWTLHTLFALVALGNGHFAEQAPPWAVAAGAVELSTSSPCGSVRAGARTVAMTAPASSSAMAPTPQAVAG